MLPLRQTVERARGTGFAESTYHLAETYGSLESRVARMLLQGGRQQCQARSAFAVLGQQITVSAASGLAGKLVRAYGEALPERAAAIEGLSLKPLPPEALRPHVTTGANSLVQAAKAGPRIRGEGPDTAAISSQLRERPGQNAASCSSSLSAVRQ